MEAKLIYDKYDEMMGLLQSCRMKKYQQWVEGVDQDCHFNLGQPLIQRDPFTSLIQVNFSKAVCPRQGLVGVSWGRGGSPGSPC
jgi:dynein heavy chain